MLDLRDARHDDRQTLHDPRLLNDDGHGQDGERIAHNARNRHVLSVFFAIRETCRKLLAGFHREKERRVDHEVGGLLIGLGAIYGLTLWLAPSVVVFLKCPVILAALGLEARSIIVKYFG